MPNHEAPASREAIIISPDPLILGELEPLLRPHLGSAPPTRVQSYPSPRDLPRAVGGGAPHLVFLDIITDRDQALQLLEEMVRIGPHVRVVVLLAQNDPDLMLRCLRLGAVDFLIRPFTGDQIEAAFGKLSRVQATTDVATAKEPARIFAVMPAKGGCGATTIASSFAQQWKRLGAKRILLADMDPLTGNLSFLLKVKSVYSFLDALNRAHELDEDLWAAMVTKTNGIDVLLAPELMLEGASELKDPTPILEYARHAYDVVVLDTNGVYGDWNLNIARTASELFLVCTNELPSLQAAQRALSYLDTNRIGRWKVRLIVNRYLRDVGLSREVIGTALHTEVFETLPSDYEAVQKALMDGKAIPSNSNFGKALAQFAERFSGSKEPAPKKTSGLSSLLGFLSKSK
jgi:pilus assembly protein CpaE